MDMVKIRYIGSLPIAATIGDVVAARGEAVEVSTALAERICAAPNWERVEESKKPRRTSRRKSTEDPVEELPDPSGAGAPVDTEEASNG